VVAETRIYALPFLSQPIALSTHFDYDSWGRIQCINYPDHEIVRYYYDLGGQLQSISNNSSYKYLDSVKYDRFGAKTSQKYGNGLVTSYTYDSYTRRLSQITVADNSNNPYGDIQYGYDPVGNVTQVTSSCPWLQNQNFSETFTYDASDQLISASETNSGSYQLTVSYGNWGKITCYSLAQADLQNNTTQSEIQSYTYPAANSLQNSQTLFAPAQRTITDANNNVTTEPLTFGINGSLRKRDVQAQNSFTEYYLFNSAANLKAYSNNGLDFAYYGYNAANTRTYKLSMLNQNQWVNGQPEPLDLQFQQAMFYPNAYLNFNQSGEYTKHYYNGAERIASRLGDAQPESFVISSNDRLGYRIMQADQQARADLLELVEAGDVPIETPSVEITSLHPTNATSNIFYYHTNHLGSTAYVTDNNAIITQGFLYAPFGEITTEYNANFGNNVLPKYAFNAKELDEETGMYYYEARYYKPPVFTSRDAMFEKYFWMTPYAYCANNPVKYVDPSGDSLTMTKEAWQVQLQAFKSVFDNKLEIIPFSYDEKTGKVIYTEKETEYTYSEEQKIIIEHYKSLCCDENYNVNVQVVDNDYKINETTLKERFATGLINNYGNGANVYISRNPLYKLDGILRECPQREDNQSISILHEVGGHAYYHSQNIHGEKNNSLTTDFENLCRSIFKGKYGSREIRRGKASPFH
jgi:RHS repeat-associated protein